MQSRQRDGQTPSRACVCVPFVPLPSMLGANPARAVDASRGAWKRSTGAFQSTSKDAGTGSRGASEPALSLQPTHSLAKRSRRRPRASATQRSKRLYPVGNRQHHNSASEAATKRRNSKNRSLSHSLIQTRQTTMSLETWIGLARNGLCVVADTLPCLLYTSPSPRDTERSRMPSSA